MGAAMAIDGLKADAATRAAIHGVPHRRMEDWRYSDLRRLVPELPQAAEALVADQAQALVAQDAFAGVAAIRLVFANGRFVPALSALSPAPALQIADLGQGLPDWAVPHFGQVKHPVHAPMADMALAGMMGGVAIRISHNYRLEAPLHLCFVNAGEGARHARVLIVLETNAHATLIESHSGGRFCNMATELVLGANATLTQLRHAPMAAGETSVHTLSAAIHAGAALNQFVMAEGAGFARHETGLSFLGRSARAQLSGVSVLSGEGHADMTTIADHAVRQCTSDQMFKAVAGGKSRAIYQGRVIVRPGADGTDSRQLAKALLASPHAEADAKPELEIHADDVTCSHGAAVGDLDADALFYLMARGIPVAQARAMLTEAFLAEVTSRLPEGAAADIIRARISAALVDAGAP